MYLRAHTHTQIEFVNRVALCATLMVPLVKDLEAPPPKSKTFGDEDTEEELERDEREENPDKARVNEIVEGLMCIGTYSCM